MPRLPVTQIEVALRLPTGWEQLLLLEAQSNETRAAIAFLTPLVSAAQEGFRVDALPVPDLEFLLLCLRALVFGDQVRTDVRCTNAVCGERVDIDFRLRDYLAGYQASAEIGDRWRTIDGVAGRFRLPTAGDLADAADAADPARQLARLCIEGAPGRSAERRIERELGRQAPSLSRVLAAACPHCSAEIPVFFDVPRFVISELRNQAAYLYGDVHQLASRYRWSEAEILNLPAQRRAHYVELAASGGVG